MYLEHLAVAENKEVLKTHTQKHIDGGISKFHRNQLKELPSGNVFLNNEIQKVVLNFHPKYKKKKKIPY